MILIRHFLSVLRAGGPFVWRSIAALILLDLVFIGIYMVWGVLHVFYGYDKPTPAWNLDTDFSASEIFNYSKWLFICSALLIVFLRTRINLFLGFAIVFAMVLADDMGQIHERGGAYLIEAIGLQPAFGLRAQDFGEVLVWAMLGSVACLVLLVTVLRSPAHARPFASFFVVILGGLVVTAMGIDIINAHEALASKDPLIDALQGGVEVLEDGGEMIVGSIGCGGALAALRTPQAVHVSGA